MSRTLVAVICAMLMLSSSIIVFAGNPSVGTEGNLAFFDGYVDHEPMRVNSDLDFNNLNGTSDWVTGGNGTADHPWVIEGRRIDARGHGYGIFVGNSTDHFVIRNCFIHNASGRGENAYYSNSGIILYNVSNGAVTHNILRDNQCGMSVIALEDDSIVEVIDALGRTVSTNEPPSRIVSCSPSITEMIYALGLNEGLVAVTDYCDWPSDVEERKVNGTLMSIGGYFTPSLEAIVVQEPDLVLLDQGVQAQMDMLPQLESSGINAMVLHRGVSFFDIRDNIGMISEICWVPEDGLSLISSMEDRLARIQEVITADVGGNLSFTDSRGMMTNLTAPATHVASFGAFATNTLVDIGMLDKAVIFDASSEFNKSAIPEMYGMPADKFITVSSANKDMVVQTMLDLVDDGKWNKTTDVIFGYGYSYLDAVWAELEGLDFNVITFYPNSYDGIVRVVNDIETVTGSTHGISRWMRSLPGYVADTLVLSGIDTAPEKVRAIYASYSSDTLKLGNNGSITTDFIRLAGGINVGADPNKTLPTYTADFSAIVALQPELVLLDGYYSGTAEEFSAMIGDSNITVFKLNKTWNSYSPQAAEGLWAVACEMYPTLFEGTVPLNVSYVPSAAFAVWLDPIYLGGNGTLVNDMMAHAMCLNAYSGLTGWPDVSVESLLELDPDYLIVSMMYLPSPGEEIISDLENDTIWSQLRAVQNKRVYIMTGQADSVFSRSGPRYVDGVEILAKIFCSDLFNASVPNLLGDNYTEHLGGDAVPSSTSGDYVTEQVPIASSYVNQVHRNVFIGNEVQASDDGLNCQWDAGYPLGGNFWSDYSGSDEFSGEELSTPGPDGIGDSSHVIQGYGGALDRYPLMTLPGAPSMIWSDPAGNAIGVSTTSGVCSLHFDQIMNVSVTAFDTNLPSAIGAWDPSGRWLNISYGKLLEWTPYHVDLEGLGHCDVEGNTLMSGNVSFITGDFTSPQSTAQVASYWQSPSGIVVRATASDSGSGTSRVDLMYRHSDNNATWSEWQNGSSGTLVAMNIYEWSLPAVSEVVHYQFESVAVDAVGNHEAFNGVAEAVCAVDAWKPISEMVLDGPQHNDGTTYVDSSTKVLIKVFDQGAGVSGHYHRVWSGEWAAWTNSTIMFSLTGEDGPRYIEHYAVDGAGNSGVIKNETLFLDSTAPC